MTARHAVRAAIKALCTVLCLTLLAIQNEPTSLWVASYNGHLPVVQFLVERGAKLEAACTVWFT